MKLSLFGATLNSMNRILINHLGYHRTGPKKAVLQSSQVLAPVTLHLVSADGKLISTIQGTHSVQPGEWSQGYFQEFDFSIFTHPGVYRLQADTASGLIISDPFSIKDAGLPFQALSDLLFYFKGQRSSGPWDRADSRAPFVGGRGGTVDAHGGWYDASGDYSKYLSHLSYANYMNPQQTPLVVWNFAQARRILAGSETDRFKGLLKRIDEEAAHGADFLLRMQDPEGYFYMTVFDRWSKDPKQREICSYSTMKGLKHQTWQASYRQGGGMAIAALARVGRDLNQWGDFSPAQYLEAAARGFSHLEKFGPSYCDDGEENILDDYCALLAATELASAARMAEPALALRCSLSSEESYLESARKRVQNLADRLMTGTEYSGWLRADRAGKRPYFHAAEAGLPLLSLLHYLETENSDKHALLAARLAKTMLSFDLGLAKVATNPFGLGRQYVKSLTGEARGAFFIPHENESGYWWQGENARLASLASAALAASRVPLVLNAEALVAVRVEGKPVLAPTKEELQAYGFDQINWILGLNPFDSCMLQGRGRNNPDYTDLYPNAPGGVCNGITSGYHNEEDIAFLPEEFAKDGMNNWRWGEQWIPHGAWLFLALSESTLLP